MKVALVQPLWNKPRKTKRLNKSPSTNDPWNEEALERHLGRDETKADLVVFPEGYPWSGHDDWEPDEYWPLEFVQAKMAAISRRTRRTFIAGGYFREQGVRSNAVMLATPGHREVQVYRKRLLWKPSESEKIITPGGLEDDVVFHFGSHAVIPLICADVFGERDDDTMNQEEQSRRQGLLERTAVLAKANGNAPIVVCAYAETAQVSAWEARLEDLIKRCSAEGTRQDVLFCNFATNAAANCPGGRSRIVSTLPVESNPPVKADGECATVSGVCVCDLGADKRTQEFTPYQLPR